MAATITDVVGANATNTNQIQLNIGATTVGHWYVVISALSNDGTNGASAWSSTTCPGGTVTNRAHILYDPGAAGAGADLVIDTVQITSSSGAETITVNTNPNISEGASRVYKVAPGSGETISFISADTTGSTGNTATYDAATVSVTNGDIIFGCAAIETDDAITGDSDTTNGSWSSVVVQLNDQGADASTMSSVSQYKTVNATGNQSWAATTSTARDSARTYIILRSAVSGVSLDLSKTLAALTLSSAYTVDTNTATLSKTLGALTLSSAYTVDTNTAALSKTLGALTSSAVFTVDSLFSLSKTLGTLTSSAVYTVDSLFSTSKTLADVTLSSAFTATGGAANFDLAKTLGALTSSASITVNTDATLAKTLGALTVSSAFTVDTNTASLSQTLGALTATGSLLVNSDFSLSKTLAALTSASVFTVSNGPQFDLARTLDALTSSAAFMVSGTVATGVPEEVHGPGWHLFGRDVPIYPPKPARVDEVRNEVLKAYARANGEEDEDQQLEDIRDLKRAAATALSVAKRYDDAKLASLAEQIIALKKFELDTRTYLERIGAIIAQEILDENDDMETLSLIASLA